MTGERKTDELLPSKTGEKQTDICTIRHSVMSENTRHTAHVYLETTDSIALNY